MYYRNLFIIAFLFNLLCIHLVIKYCGVSVPLNLNLIHSVDSKCAYSDYYEMSNFNTFNNETGTEDGRYIVPNFVHFIRFDLQELSFIDAVCILAAYKNQKPEKIFIHSNRGEPKGKYWEVLVKNVDLKETLVIKNITLPQEIFGKKLSDGWKKWHGSDISRIRVVMKYGGIYLDNDSYLVRSLNDFRRYEMTLGWMENAGLANQVIIANKNARFLKEWLKTYKKYDKNQWYYNAGVLPTEEVLKERPYLIHRERYLLANHLIASKLYLEDWKEWKSHYAIHLLYNHQYILGKNLSDQATYPVKFNETNIVHYPVTIRDMVYDVYPIPSA